MNYSVWNQLGQPAAEMRRFKNVFEYPAKVFPGGFICKNRHCSVSEIQRPNVIQPENMVNMAMSNEYRIEISDICPQCLLTKIR